MSDALSALLRALQASGLDVDAEGALDATWLGIQLHKRTLKDAPADGRPTPIDTARTTAATSPGGDASSTTETDSIAAELVQVDELYGSRIAASGHSASARGIALTRTAALPDARGLIKALRPLRRRIVAPGSSILDIDTTVNRAVEERLWIPSFEPTRERWLDVLLVADHGLSMIIWKETVDEFERVLRNSGAFRSVRSWWVESDAVEPSVAARGRGRSPTTPKGLTRLVRSGSRSVILVVSDCVGPRWHDGAIPKLMSHWSKTVPIALMQVTPEWFWARTALGDTAASEFRSTAGALLNSQLKWDASAFGATIPDSTELLRVPAATLTGDALAKVADLVAGVGRQWTPGVVFDLTWERSSASQVIESSAAERVDRFLNLASKDAKRLASAFAASPIRTLGVLRLLRRDLIPHAGPFVEAEILLGGIVAVPREKAGWNHGAELPLEFPPGVQPMLLDGALAGDVLRVLARAASVAASGVAPTFTAWLDDPSSSGSLLDPEEGEFAKAAAESLLRLGGSYAKIVKRPPRPDPLPPGVRAEFFKHAPPPGVSPSPPIVRLTELAFDEKGEIQGPGPSSVSAAIHTNEITDLIVIVHGWNVDRSSARTEYSALIENIARLRDLPATRTRRIGTLGVLWPSRQLSSEDDSPSMDDAPTSVNVERQKELEQATATLQTNPDDERALDRLSAVVQEIDAERASSSSSAVTKRPGVFGSIWESAKNALRLTSYYQMQSRSRDIGIKGLGPFLGQLALLEPTVRVHLVGHSFGARLAGHAVKAAMQDYPNSLRIVKSLTLLQATMSQFVFAREPAPGMSQRGGLADALEAVDGPLIVTLSRNDKAVGVTYPLATRVSAGDIDARGEKEYEALGVKGAQGVSATPLTIGSIGQRYDLRAGQIYNVDASNVVRSHGDTFGPEIAWLILSAIGQTVVRNANEGLAL